LAQNSAKRRPFSRLIAPSFAVCDWAGNKLWGHYPMSGDPPTSSSAFDQSTVDQHQPSRESPTGSDHRPPTSGQEVLTLSTIARSRLASLLALVTRRIIHHTLRAKNNSMVSYRIVACAASFTYFIRASQGDYNTGRGCDVENVSDESL